MTARREPREAAEDGSDGSRFRALIQSNLDDGLAAHGRLAANGAHVLSEIAALIDSSLARGGTLILFGNGGSAADAQHVAAELVGRFGAQRAPLAAIALTTDSSALTAFGNDFGFEHVFARQMLALARAGDVAVGISTSGRSPNVLAGLRAARDRGAAGVGFTGASPSEMDSLCALCFHAPAADTQRVQELHLLAWHAVCAAVDRAASEREELTRR